MPPTEQLFYEGSFPDIPYTDSKIQITAVDKVATIMRKVAWCYNTFIQGLPLKTNHKENYNISLNLKKEMKLSYNWDYQLYFFLIGKTKKRCAWLLSLVESFLSISFTIP